MKNANKNEITKVVELTQDTAQATLNTSVEVVKLAEDSLQGLYKVGYDLNASGLTVAKGYWDALSAIRNEWINLFQETGNKAVSTIGTLSNMEIPYQKEVTEFGGNVFAQGEKVFNMASDQVKAVANTVTAQVEKATKTVSNVSNKVEKATTTVSAKVEKATETATKEVKKATKVASKKVEKANDKAIKVTKDVVATVENVANKATAKVEDAAAQAKKATAGK